ncbi:MAG TPA: substrate-binding domain-containing protein, partial [Polyangiaceae bacterium]|nr:substrate-binding domain-containing protein [Polyangiaceae bacterium]
YEGNVKVLDFGVAKTAFKTSETQAGVLKGKLAYMAPEQATGQAVDRRSDVFAAGAVLWELLTLQRLRTSETAAGVLEEAAYGRLPDLSRFVPDADRKLEGLLWHALAQYPRRRFQTAQEMRDALIDYLATTPCSQEEAADFMQQRFGQLREAMQRQISACLQRVEARAPTIVVSQGPASDRAPLVDFSAGSLPLLESGSLPVRHEDATTPLAPGEMLSESLPAPRSQPTVPSRSRSLTFTEETERDGGLGFGQLAILGAVAAAAALAAFWWQGRAREPTHAGPVPASPLTAAPQEVVLRLHGSNTIGQDLAPRLAEGFMKQRGYANVERSAPADRSQVSGRDPRDGKLRSVEIVALGSSTAFADLASGDCDIGLSSRRIKPAETALLRERGRGDLESAAGEHVVGLDGIAVIVHPNSPLERIDLQALRRIFSGEVSDFSAVGGPPGPLHLYARDDRSGTVDTFKHLVLGERPLSSNAERLSDSAELSSAVARDPQGIGFVGIPYVRGARALSVGAAESGATFLHPSTFTVATEGYALSRRLYLYVPVQNVKPLALELINFALSGPGQEIVRATGFVDLMLYASATAGCDRCPASYAKLSQAGKRLSLDFRFRTGSAELDSRGLRDLDRLLAFLRENAQSRLVLVGFSDSRGSPAQNSKLSLERAKKIAAELSERGVPAVDVEAMGSALPVASNDSEDGREKNRRVEVWLR